ncbi:hypothetical protein [Desulfosporosinus sp. SB140]|uniref:hypothetical protein n=1 Tax=Desulfosporosinus paludis TaxID=3115649 RepID=UPI00388F62FA
MANLIKIDLSELGEGQYVEIKDPKIMPYGFQKQLQEKFKNDSIDSIFGGTEFAVLKLIKNGYVLDEDDNPIPFPINAESLLLLPMLAINTVMLKYGEIAKQGANIPNA